MNYFDNKGIMLIFLFSATFLLFLVYSFSRKKLLNTFKERNSLIKMYFLNSLLLAFAVVFIFLLLQPIFFEPTPKKAASSTQQTIESIQRDNNSSGESKSNYDMFTTVLVFISIALTGLTGIAVFAFHSIYENFKDNTAQNKEQSENLITKGKEQSENIENLVTSHKRQIGGTVIYSKLHKKAFDYYLDSLNEQNRDEKQTREIMSTTTEIIPIFSDDFDDRAAISHAFDSLKTCSKDNPKIIEELLDKKAWEYIENEIRPQYKSDVELHNLICEVIKNKGQSGKNNS